MRFNRIIPTRAAVAAMLSLLLCVAVAPQTWAQEKVVVFAAASMKNALDNATKAWMAQGKPEVTVSYAASSALAKQAEAGAPADVFISADLDWMQYLSDRKLVKQGTRFNWLGNRLVLVASKERAGPVDIKPGFDLAGLLGGGKLAMGLPSSVPAGKYGKAALEKLGIWSAVEKQVAGAESVRAALALVSRGEAPFGIVYQTDAAADPNVAVVATFPEASHPPIIYPAAIVETSTSKAAGDYVAFLKSEDAAKFFKEEGFTVLNEAHSQ